MQRKSLHKRSTVIQLQADSNSIGSYKNQNILFKIHSTKGQETYNEKTFPAKFSINICSEPTEFTSTQYSRENIRSTIGSQDGYPSKKIQIDELKNQRNQPDSNIQYQYEKQLRNLAEQKAEIQKIAEALERDCIDYVNQNQELAAVLGEKDEIIKDLQEKLENFEGLAKNNGKVEQQLRGALSQKDLQIKELWIKIKGLQNENKRVRQVSGSKQKQDSQNLRNLQNRIAELESVIKQKEQTIKNLASFNNEICVKMLDEKSYLSSNHVKQMQKWLKMLNKKYQSKSVKKIQDPQQNAIITQLLQKNSYFTERVLQLEKINSKLIKQNTNTITYNEELKRRILQIESQLEHKEKQTQQSFMKKPFNNTLNQINEGGIVYEGTVKVKMEYLLIEKDRRISALESQLQDCKNENIALRSKMYQLDCQRDFFNETLRNNDETLTLRKARSLQNFFPQNSQGKMRNQSIYQTQKDTNTKQFSNIISQCNNLTQNLSNFLQTCKTDRSTYEQECRKQRIFSQTQPMNLNLNHEREIEKMRELMYLQKTTFDLLEKNLKKSHVHMNEEEKWNTNEKFCINSQFRTEKENLGSPIKQRNIFRQEFIHNKFSRARGTSLCEQRA